MNGTAITGFVCKKEYLQSIYAKMKELSIFELSGNMISGSIFISPNEIFQIRYRINGKEYLLSGDSSTGRESSDRNRDLLVFVEYLKDFMRGTPEYCAMPEEEGGYD